MSAEKDKIDDSADKYLEQITKFEQIRPVYCELADLIEKILRKAVESLSILAIVQSRPKSIVSFSGKIITKDKYREPLTEITDLCGSRVIVYFQSQVEKLCSFIRDNFDIDEVNSLDTRSRLQVNEFGYRSVHYIVSLNKDSIMGEVIPEKLRKLKSEIQVRTLAEHLWAVISHDRLYKTPLNIPDEWKREAARLSAMLENADREFAAMSKEIDSIASVYELQFRADKAGIDIVKFRTLISVLLENPDEKIKNSLKLSTIYRAKDQYNEAVVLLKPLLNIKTANPLLHLKLSFEYGVVLAMSGGEETNDAANSDGLKMIRRTLKELERLPEIIQKEHREELSYIFYRAGKLLQQDEEEIREVADLFTKAHNMMPDNPLYLVALIDSIVLRNLDMAEYSISLFSTNINHAIYKLEELIDIGIQMVPALFAIGHCYLLTNDETRCINAYSRAVAGILDKNCLTSHKSIFAEIKLIGRMKSRNPKLAEKIKLYLNMAMFLAAGDSSEKRVTTTLANYRNKREPWKSPVVILAGGAAWMDLSKVKNYKEYITELMHDFKGSIISGGTTAGIPGLAGEVKKELNEKGAVEFNLEAYLPEKLPDDAIKSTGYDTIYETPSDQFSALDILICWTDLICGGIKPEDVILIGIDGGRIATMEYRIALSLGAKVALAEYSGRAVTDFLQEKHWKNHPNLLVLPNDPLTVWALVNNSAETILTPEEINKLAPISHDFYREKRLGELNPKAEDVNKYKVLMPWHKLDPVLQNSNRKQVAFYEQLLKRVNLRIRKADDPVLFNPEKGLDEDEYNFIARLEHARWNAERLMEGWKYGPEKDISKKLNPYLVPWTDLDDITKSYDYDPVNNIPMLLAKIGYEVYRPSSLSPPV